MRSAPWPQVRGQAALAVCVFGAGLLLLALAGCEKGKGKAAEMQAPSGPPPAGESLTQDTSSRSRRPW